MSTETGDPQSRAGLLVLEDPDLGLDLYIAYEGDSFPAEQLADILAGLNSVTLVVAEAELELVNIETGHSIVARFVGVVGTALTVGTGIVVGLPVLAIVGGITGVILTLAQADEAGANAEKLRAEARAINEKLPYETEALDADAALKRADAALKRAQAIAQEQKNALAAEDVDTDEIIRRLQDDPEQMAKVLRAARAITRSNVRQLSLGSASIVDQEAS